MLFPKNKDSEQHYPESYSIYLLIYEFYFTQRLMIGI